jgi:hypothetical protein
MKMTDVEKERAEVVVRWRGNQYRALMGDDGEPDEIQREYRAPSGGMGWGALWKRGDSMGSRLRIILHLVMNAEPVPVTITRLAARSDPKF